MAPAQALAAGLRSTARAAALSAAIALAVPASARADDPTLPFQAHDRREALGHLITFERKSKEGEWRSAVDELQRLLDTPPEQAVVIRMPSMSPARFEGAAVVARRLFDALPPEGRAAWEAKSRKAAEDLIARGLRLRREDDLADAARRYPARDVRRRAAHALAELALVRSDVAAAQFHLIDLADACEPAERAETLARLAFVSAQLGDTECVARVVRDAAGKDAAEMVPSGRGQEPLGAFAARMAELAAAGARATASRNFGGDARGTGVADAPARPERIRWIYDTDFMDGSENDRDSMRISGRDIERLTPAIPVVSHGLAFVNNGLSLAALNLVSGGQVWRRDSTVRQHGAEWRDSFVQTHTAAVADGVVYATLAAPSIAGAVSANGQRTAFGRTILYPLPHRILYALDARTGEVLWSHEDAQIAGRDDAAEIRRECVSSPPLVVGEDVVVSAWSYDGIFDVRLVCFDRRTGRTRWRTSLAQGQQELNLFGRPVKELTTGPVAALGGRVFVATGLGVAAAVDRKDGAVAWLTAYDQTPIPSPSQWFQTLDRDVVWFPSTVAAVPEGVVMAPPDGRELTCFDPATGNRRWGLRSDADAGERYRWFAGVSDGRAYAAGSRVVAIDVATGSRSWKDDRAGRLGEARGRDSETAGAVVLTRENLYVPLSRGIAVIATDSGALTARWPLPVDGSGSPVTGGLTTGEGSLLVTDRRAVRAAFDLGDLAERLERRLAESPDDAQVRLDAGEAYAAAGRIDLAIETLSGAMPHLGKLASRARDRVETSVRRALYTALLARALVRSESGDVPGAALDYGAAAEAARDRGDAVRALFRLASVLGDAGRHDDADAALRRIATEYTEVVTTADDGERAHSGALARYRLGESAFAAHRTSDAVALWLDLLEQRGNEDLGATDVATAVKERLAEAAKVEPAAVGAAIRSRARAALDAARKSGDASLLDRASRLYPDPEIAAESALLASDLHLAAGRPRDAVGVLGALLATPRAAPVTAAALWRLAAAYRALGESARERAQLRRLAAETPDEVVRDGVKAKDAALRELESPRLRDAGPALPDPRAPLTLLWQAGGADEIAPQARSLPVEGNPLLADRIAVTQAGVLRLVDEQTGAPVWSARTGCDVRETTAGGGLVVLAGSDSSGGERAVVVAAFSTDDGREAWPRRRIPGQFRAAAASLGVYYLLYVEPGALGARPNYGLSAVSMSTGDLLAQRSFPGVLQTQLTLTEDALVVTEPSRARDAMRRVLLALDATSLSLRARVELSSGTSPWASHPPLSPLFVTSDGNAIVALDTARGETAWRTPITGGASAKNVFALSTGVIVSDDADAVRRLALEDGRQVWRTPLGGAGNLVYSGESAEGDLVVATLKPPRASAAVIVALDAATGAERWRTDLDLTYANTMPHPQILASLVALEIAERDERGSVRARVVLLDRATGRIVQTLDHPTIGRSAQSVTYGPDWISLNNVNELAVYGTRREAK